MIHLKAHCLIDLSRCICCYVICNIYAIYLHKFSLVKVTLAQSYILQVAHWNNWLQFRSHNLYVANVCSCHCIISSVMESCKNFVLVQWLLSSDWNFAVLWSSVLCICVQLYICRNCFATLIHLELYFMSNQAAKTDLAQDKCW